MEMKNNELCYKAHDTITILLSALGTICDRFRRKIKHKMRHNRLKTYKWKNKT